MKGGIVAAAAAVLATGATAHGHHAHNVFHNKRGGENQVCSTVWTTILGPPTWVPAPPPPVTTTVIAECTECEATSTAPVTTSSSTAVVTTSSAAPPPPPPPPKTTITTTEVVLPTPHGHSCPTPGTYTWTAETITVTKETTVCGATSTAVPPGTHTVGGVTTVVETQTTVVCPYATVQTSGTVTTSTLLTTTYVCPSAGTYTIAPTVTVCPSATTVTYVVPTTISTGTYTAPEQVVTITDTNTVYYCPYTSVGLPTTSAAPPPPPPTSSAVVKVQKVSVAAPPPVVAETKSSHSSASAPPPSSGGSAGGDLVGTNDHYGLTYTPYVPSTGDCKTASEVDDDVAAIKSAGFQVLRVYSTDCNTLENVGNAAEKHGMDMFIGVFVKDSGCSAQSPDIKEQLDTISSWGKFDLVKLFIVGNEAIANGYCSASELAQLVKDTKAACGAYKGPYTISETINIWQQPGVADAIVEVVDVCAANIHPYFNPQTTPETAGDFVVTELQMLKHICPGKKTLNVECGWPTAGQCNGSACPGEEEQAVAIKSIREKTGDVVVFFSSDNDMWKDQGTCGCEQSWGCKSAFGF